MSTPRIDVFELDPAALTRTAINGIRVAFGVVGILTLGLGIALLVWPGRTLAVGTAMIGIYLVIAGIARLAMGIFSRGLSGGHRTLGILMGLLLILAGVVALRNLTATTAVLLVIAAITVGFGWIIEGVMALVESRGTSRGWGIFFGIVSILAGLTVIVIPGWSASVFILLTAVMFIVLGVVGVIRAFTFGRDVKPTVVEQ